MNRNLFVFSLLLVFAGVGLDFYFISFIGLLLMIPSLLVSSRPPVRTAPQPSQTQQMPWRISPPAHVQQEPKAPTVETKVEVPMPAPMPAVPPSPMASSVATYSPPLFPMPIIPALSPVGYIPGQPKGTSSQKQGEGDELVEVGAILVLLKLALG
jgi:hypothetical protein